MGNVTSATVLREVCQIKKVTLIKVLEKLIRTNPVVISFKTPEELSQQFNMYIYRSNINRSTIIHGITLWIVDCSHVHNIALRACISYHSNLLFPNTVAPWHDTVVGSTTWNRVIQ